MTVKELIERLQRFDPDLEVIVSQDAEGNAHSPLDALAVGRWDGEEVFDLDEDEGDQAVFLYRV